MNRGLGICSLPFTTSPLWGTVLLMRRKLKAKYCMCVCVSTSHSLLLWLYLHSLGNSGYICVNLTIYLTAVHIYTSYANPPSETLDLILGCPGIFPPWNLTLTVELLTCTYHQLDQCSICALLPHKILWNGFVNQASENLTLPIHC